MPVCRIQALSAESRDYLHALAANFSEADAAPSRPSKRPPTTT
jgi:hypothetical protein